jgi:O-antigen ligase
VSRGSKTSLGGGLQALIVGAAVLIACAAIALFRTEAVAAIAAAVVVVFMAYRFPAPTIVALLVVSTTTRVFQMTPGWDETWEMLFAGIRVTDVLLVGMAGASVAKLLSRPFRSARATVLSCLAAAFAAWLAFEMVRNVGAYGIASLGEFRFRYLILALPVYVMTMLDTAEKRRRAFVAVWWLMLPVVLAFVPAIGVMKGWSIGDTNRFLPSPLSLGLVYGVLTFWLARSHGLMRVPRWAGGVMTTAAAALVLADGHRSVWLALAVALLTIALLGELPLRRAWAWGSMALLLGVVVALLATGVGFNTFEYVSQRGSAFIQPMEDATSAWRLYVWKAQLERVASTPFTGTGFGSYWSVYVPELRAVIDLMPHNLYVQTLVKLGLVGLGLLVGLALQAGAIMNRIRRALEESVSDRLYIVLGLTALSAQLAYGVAYPLEANSLVLVGLGMSAALWTLVGSGRGGDREHA